MRHQQWQRRGSCSTRRATHCHHTAEEVTDDVAARGILTRPLDQLSKSGKGGFFPSVLNIHLMPGADSDSRGFTKCSRSTVLSKFRASSDMLDLGLKNVKKLCM